MNPDWKKVNLSGEDSGLIWIEISQDDGLNCCCYFTNLVNIYSERLNKVQIETRFREQNSGIETEDYQEFLMNVKTALLDRQTTVVSVREETCAIKIDWSVDGIEYKWSFLTNIESNHLFYKLVSYPLVSVIQQLRRDKETLLAVIQSKDLEIEDYENNGSRLSLKKLKTGKFDPDTLKTPADGNVIDTVSIVADPETWDILQNVSVKDLFESKGESSSSSIKENIKSENTNESFKRNKMNSDPPSSEEDLSSRKKIKLEKPNLSQIAQKSNRFNNTKKKSKF